MPSYFRTTSEIDRIGRGLVERSLPKREWTHAAHFAAALWLLRHHPEWDVAAALPKLIRAYNESTGVANTNTGGYHETITLASLRAARNVLHQHAENAPLHAVANDLLAGEWGRSDWLLDYWSRERLFSVAARKRWLEPDRRPLPFL
jgi:hypothetical protein